METKEINEYIGVREIEGKNRIVALKDFMTLGNYKVKKGDIGGTINDDVDLYGKSWIDYNSDVVDISLVDSYIRNSKVDGNGNMLESCYVHDCEDMDMYDSLYAINIGEVTGAIGYIVGIENLIKK